MPTPTPKLGIPKPLGNETVSRAAFNQIWDIIDQNAASQAQVDEPFHLKSATYDAGNNRLALVFGPGRAAFLGTLVAKTADETYYIPSPATNTAYTIYVRSDGTFMHNTTGAEVAGAVPIWRVRTGATVDQIAVEDLRGRLPGAAARAVKDLLDSHMAAADPHPQYAADADLSAHKSANPMDHPAGSVTDAHLGNRTVDDAQVPTDNTGFVGQILSWLANRIRAITGMASWRDAPPTTLAAAKAHMDAAAPHSGHETPSGAQQKVDAHASAVTGVHGVGTARVAKTTRPDQWPSWSDIPDKPSAFPPSAHKSTHAQGGSDPLTPADIGAVQNAGGVPSILAGAEASRPAAGVAGRIYIATDTQRIYRDTGSAWVLAGVVNWGDVANKPATFPPSPHKSTHAQGGSDPLTPADIGALANKFGRAIVELVRWGAATSPGASNGKWIKVAEFVLNGNYDGRWLYALIFGRDSNPEARAIQELLVKVRNGTTGLELNYSTLYLGTRLNGRRAFRDARIVHRSGSGVSNNVVEVWLQFDDSSLDDIPVLLFYDTYSFTFIAKDHVAEQTDIPSGYITAIGPNVAERLVTGATVDGNIIWHAGNDGAGSGLDADLLDGMQPTSPGGTEANRVAATDALGRVGRAINADQLGGVAASSYARKDIAEAFAAAVTVNGALVAAGSAGLPSAGGGSKVYLAAGYASPVAGRIIVGDGTGWLLHFSRLSGGAVTDLITIRDNGTLDLNATAEGRLVLPVGTDKYAV